MTEEYRNRYIDARKSIIAADLGQLNEMQRRAAMATEGPLLLLAGAGSGKTTVLINRIATILRYGRASDSDELPADAEEAELALLEEAADGRRECDEHIRRLCAIDPPAPWNILAITFTNKAAGELRDRLVSRLGADGADVWAMTFHGACARILRRDADRLGFDKSFTIYDQADSLAVMKRIIREMNVDEKVWAPKAMLTASARYKAQLLAPEQYLPQAKQSGDIRRIRTAEICAAYTRRLKASNAMDFEDLLYYCVRLLQDNRDVLEYYQRKFHYVLIDEYQDTNHLQYLMATMLAGGRDNICVVGDDDQSIYKFRGATIENILSFESQYKDSRVIRLEQNYRSTGNILDAANAVIANNTARKGKHLWTEAGSGEPITFYRAASEEEESEFVAKTIRQAHMSEGRNYRDFAVLYRTNAQSRVLEQTMNRFGIPVRIFGGTRFYDRSEVKDMLAYLWVVANPADETRLLRIINTPARGIGTASIERAQDIAAKNAIPLFEVLRTASDYPELSRAAKQMEAFAAMITGLQEMLGWAGLDEFYDALLEQSGYVRALENKNSDEELSRIENIRELKSSIVRHMERPEGGDLYSFLDEVSLYTDLDNYDENADTAVMMTMHSAKGLEFPAVFIVGAEEGLFPNMLAIGEPEEMEEERRLCYVAITRAKEKLFICCAAMRMIFGRTGANPVSRFVEEIPPELLEQQESRRLHRETRGGAPDVTRRRYEPVSAHPMAPVGRSRPHTELGGENKAEFAVGDRVKHKVFGEGTITGMTPMGGDALVEVEFAEQGTKRLMLRVAGMHMEKLS